MNQESTPGLEPNNQILAAAIQERDPLAFELAGDLRRVVRTRQACIGDLDPLEDPALEHWCEPPADRLDLWQLGHGRTVAPRR